MRLWYGVLVVLFLSMPALAATVSVSPGDNLTAAVAHLHPGDTLHLAAGLYTQGISLGPQLSQIRIDGAGAVLRPAGCGVLGFVGAQHVTVTGLTIDGSHLACGRQTTNGVYMSPHSHHITLDGVTVRDVSNNGGRTSVGIESGADNVTLRGVTVNATHVNAGDFQGAHCLYLAAPGDNVQVIGGTFANCGGWGIQYNDSGGKGDGGNSGGLIQGATVVGNGRRSGSGGGGIVLNNHINTTLVYNNNVHDQAKGCGIDVWGSDNHDNVLVGNTLTNNPAGCACIGISHARDTILQDNHCDTLGGIRIFDGAQGTRVNQPGTVPPVAAIPAQPPLFRTPPAPLRPVATPGVHT